MGSSDSDKDQMSRQLFELKAIVEKAQNELK